MAKIAWIIQHLFLSVTLNMCRLGEMLTYQQLNERADAMAEWLRLQFRLEPESLVAICLERSPLLLVCILAVLKV